MTVFLLFRLVALVDELVQPDLRQWGVEKRDRLYTTSLQRKPDYSWSYLPRLIVLPFPSDCIFHLRDFSPYCCCKHEHVLEILEPISKLP